jgi:hypothetical protein
MASATKQTGKTKTSKSAALGASSRAIELPDGMWERISKKAFELWQERGCREGQALRDWLDAETIVMEENHEARE